jgi:hypothetical protein
MIYHSKIAELNLLKYQYGSDKSAVLGSAKPHGSRVTALA